MLVEPVTINWRDFDAAIFDLDGVLTDTARVHAAAWKTVFDAFLQKWAQRHGQAFQPFDIAADYLDYVDGRPRDDGVRSFLAAGGINLPEGSERNPEAPTQCTLWANARHGCFYKRCKMESAQQRASRRF